MGGKEKPTKWNTIQLEKGMKKISMHYMWNLQGRMLSGKKHGKESIPSYHLPKNVIIYLRKGH